MGVLLDEDEKHLGLAIKQVLIGEKYVVDWVTLLLTSLEQDTSANSRSAIRPKPEIAD